MIWIRLTALYASRSACSRSVCASLLLPALGASRSVCDRSVCDGSVCVQRSLCLCSLCMRWLGPRSVCMRWAWRRWLWVSLTTLPTFQPTNQFKFNLRIIDGISILDKSQNLDGWLVSFLLIPPHIHTRHAEPSARRAFSAPSLQRAALHGVGHTLRSLGLRSLGLRPWYGRYMIFTNPTHPSQPTHFYMLE